MMRVVTWGTYDIGKPRIRIMLQGLREAGLEPHEVHVDVWAGVPDKGSVSGAWNKVRLLLKWLAAYPSLIYRYLRTPHHDVVVVGYLGHLDVLVLWPFAKLRGIPVVWDAFLSLYNTVVEDRRLLAPANPLAWLLYAWEWLACRAVRKIVLDTKAHADYFAETYGLKPGTTASIPVGAEPEFFTSETPCRSEGAPLKVLFYGQFIPLHGIETIVRAAQAAYGEPIHWILIGRGQEQGRIRTAIAEAPATIEWIEWVEFETLADHIARSDICLGIFGDSEKAARVIPNKVFQILAAGAPLITRDSPAIRELLSGDMPGIVLVPPADPAALLAAVHRLRDALPMLAPRPLHGDIAEHITPKALGRSWRAMLEDVTGI